MSPDGAAMFERHVRMMAAVEAGLRFFNRTINKNGRCRVSDVRLWLESRYPDVAAAATNEVRDRLARRYG
jgi:hypothetical protein